MEEPTDPYQEWTRPLLGQPPEITSTYIEEEIRDNAIRAHTVRAHEQEVAQWLVSLSIISSAFEPRRIYDSQTPEPGSPDDTSEQRQLRSAFALRLQLLGLVGRAAKLILDSILAAYYTEAWTLLRTMLDGWARCLFVRLSPSENVRWYEHESAYDDKPVDWAQIENAVNARGTDEDRELFRQAKLRWELLHMGTHPSGEGIGQVRNDELNIFMYRPEYHHGFCMHAFSAGIFIMRAVIREIQLLGGHEEWWTRTAEKHAAIVESLEVAITPTLNEMAVRLERRRVARREARQQARNSQPNN